MDQALRLSNARCNVSCVRQCMTIGICFRSCGSATLRKTPTLLAMLSFPVLRHIGQDVDEEAIIGGRVACKGVCSRQVL